MDRTEIEKVVSGIVNAAVGGKKKCSCDKKLTLEKANALCNKVIDEAKARGIKVVVAVSGAGARPISVMSMDDAYIASYDIAVNKAYTSVSLKMSTSKLSELASPGGELYGIQHTNGGQIVIFGGGEPLYINERLVGAVGISGGTLCEDTNLGEFAAKVWKEEICR